MWSVFFCAKFRRDDSDVSVVLTIAPAIDALTRAIELAICAFATVVQAAVGPVCANVWGWARCVRRRGRHQETNSSRKTDQARRKRTLASAPHPSC